MVKAVFFGTAEIACPSLRALAGSKIAQVSAVVSQPDRPKGRDMRLQPTPVKETAMSLGVPVLQPEKAKAEGFLAELRAIAPEIIVVMAYGQILPPALLAIPKLGCVNLHTSILPKHRGAAPIQWALINGDTETGVTLMKMDAGMDTGPMFAVARTPIAPEDDAQTLHDRLGTLGAELLLGKLPGLLEGTISPSPQPEGATHARKITKEDGRLRWTDPAVAIWNRIRALQPWPGGFTTLPAAQNRDLLKIFKAEPLGTGAGAGVILKAHRDELVIGCGSGSLRLIEVQREGGKRLRTRDFLAGCRLEVGEQLE